MILQENDYCHACRQWSTPMQREHGPSCQHCSRPLWETMAREYRVAQYAVKVVKRRFR